MADTVEKMRRQKIFRKLNFVFFNALFSNAGGYNSLKIRHEKIGVFNSALHSLEHKFSPDLILIGCNTLSVLYSGTEFSKTTKIPVIGIVESGVDLIAQNLKSHPESKVILFATQTTIEEGTYKDRLTNAGFQRDRIISHACPDLVPYIERGYESDETEMLIQAYVDEALQKVGKPIPPLIISFNCTHYGYSLKLWKKAMQDLGANPLIYLNPNSRIADILANPRMQNRYSKILISVRVVSMVSIGRQQLESFGSYLKAISSQTAEALHDYQLNQDLFEWKNFIKRSLLPTFQPGFVLLEERCLLPGYL